MPFRINYQGAVIEADTAPEVQQLLVALAQPVPRGLLAPADESVPAARPARRSLKKAVRRASKTRVGGGVAKPAPLAPKQRPVDSAFVERVLAAVTGGISKPADIVAHVKSTKFIVRLALKRLAASGRVRAEGATLSRRYYPAGKGSARPAGAKEGL